MEEILGPQGVSAELKQPLIEFLLGLADDECILGYWDSEWTGVAPILEEDVAMSSIAQDEIGHARLLYGHVSALTGTPVDQLVYGRQPEHYRQVQLVERQRGDWAFTIARQFFYDTAEQLRVQALKTSTYLPLAQDMAKIEREEVYHQMHVHVWLERLANRTFEGRQRLEQALEQLWPDALGMFEPFIDEEALLRAGILPTASASLRQIWLAAIAPIFERLHLPLASSSSEETSADSLSGQTTMQDPAQFSALSVQANALTERTTPLSFTPDKTARRITPRTGGRRGEHTQDFRDLWEQMTMVYRLEPQAQW